MRLLSPPLLLIHLLSFCSLNCAILASAGQQRSRILATLFKDERCKELSAYPILHAMYLDRIVQQSEVDVFASLLQDHQKAINADGLCANLPPAPPLYAHNSALAGHHCNERMRKSAPPPLSMFPSAPARIQDWASPALPLPCAFCGMSPATHPSPSLTIRRFTI